MNETVPVAAKLTGPSKHRHEAVVTARRNAPTYVIGSIFFFFCYQQWYQARRRKLLLCCGWPPRQACSSWRRIRCAYFDHALHTTNIFPYFGCTLRIHESLAFPARRPHRHSVLHTRSTVGFICFPVSFHSLPCRFVDLSGVCVAVFWRDACAAARSRSAN